MSENIQDSGRRAFGDLTNVLGKRPAPMDLVKNAAGGIKIGRVERAVEPKKGFDKNVMASGATTIKENIVRPSIFYGAKVQHMAAEAAGLLSKEVSAIRNHSVLLDSSGLNDKEDSSLESEGGCEEEDDDCIDSELLAYTRDSKSSKMVPSDRGNDGECLTQEELVGSSGNQALPSVDLTTGDDMPCANALSPPLGICGLKEAGATNSCACSFCLKAAFMLTDLHYQDARGRLAALKKSIKFARSLDAKGEGNKYAVNAGRQYSKRAAEMEFELSQQQRSLFLYTQNVLIRESAQLHPALVKLKDLRESCKTDLETSSHSILGK